MRAVSLERYEAPTISMGPEGDVPLGRYVGRLVEEPGPEVYFFADLRPTQVLRVVFHGAMLGQDTYPRFDRIRSTQATGDALLSFADPTVSLSEELGLGWFLGGPDWDPMQRIADVVRQASAQCGARSILLVGSSGGGFAAMRLGLLLPESIVVAFNPQTSPWRYLPAHLERYLRIAHGVDPEHVDASFKDSGRMDMVTAYTEPGLKPTVLYSQNLLDPHHIEHHYVPFKKAAGLPEPQGAGPSMPTVWFELYEPERVGNRPPTPVQFEAACQRAISWNTTLRGLGRFAPGGHLPPVAALSPEPGPAAPVGTIAPAPRIGPLLDRMRTKIVADMISVISLGASPTGRLPVLTGWSMAPEDLRRVLTHVEEAPAASTILELGSGASTVWIADAIRRRGGDVSFVSLEHDDQYLRQTRAALEHAGLEEYVDLRHAPLGAVDVGGAPYMWYTGWEGERNVSILLVDGPPKRTGPRARFPAIDVIEHRLMEGGVVILDDVHRPDEASILEEWRSLGVGFSLSEGILVDRSCVSVVSRREGERR